jgi:anti-anti-sigma factor
MILSVQPAEGTMTRIQSEGDITHLDLFVYGDPLEKVLGPGCYLKTVLMNLDKTPYIDSAGIGWLIKSHKLFLQSGGKLILHSIPPSVKHMFQLLKLNHLLHMAEDEVEAQQLALGGKR